MCSNTQPYVESPGLRTTVFRLLGLALVLIGAALIGVRVSVTSEWVQ